MPRSKAEVRWAHAHPENKYAREVIAKMHGRHMSELPEHTGKGAKRPFKGKRKAKK